MRASARHQRGRSRRRDLPRFPREDAAVSPRRTLLPFFFHSASTSIDLIFHSQRNHGNHELYFEIEECRDFLLPSMIHKSEAADDKIEEL